MPYEYVETKYQTEPPVLAPGPGECCNPAQFVLTTRMATWCLLTWGIGPMGPSVEIPYAGRGRTLGPRVTDVKACAIAHHHLGRCRDIATCKINLKYLRSH